MTPDSAAPKTPAKTKFKHYVLKYSRPRPADTMLSHLTHIATMNCSNTEPFDSLPKWEMWHQEVGYTTMFQTTESDTHMKN